MKNVYLTKTKFLSWLQCPKKLQKELDPGIGDELDEVAKHTIAMGNKLGKMAQELFEDGLDIDQYRSIEQKVKATKKALKDHCHTIYEGTFISENLLAKADILKVLEDGNLKLIEVKSKTKVSDENIYDVYFEFTARVLRSASERSNSFWH